ncbi:MAG: TadE/TadG family type IV pilus assembly protein, partial [Pseudomonadota bacterium]
MVGPVAGKGIINRTAQLMSSAGRGFRRDERGNVAIMVGLLAMPMLAAVGVAVDMGEAHRGKVNFQAALDAGALAAAKSFARGKTDNEAANAANRVFQANINSTLPGSIGTISMTSSAADCTGNGIVATGTLKHPIFFGKVHKVFQQTHPGHAFLQGSTTVKCGAKTVEIAMVLDNSGSMGWSNKMGTLKNASKQLVDTVFDSLSASPYPDPVKFSLIPFASMVNVGTNNRNASWMDTTGRSSIHHETLDWENDPIALKQGSRFKNKNNGQWLTRFTLYDEMRVDWKGCVESRADPYFVTDDAPSASNPDTYIVPGFAPDNPDNWTGYIDRVESGSIRHIYCTRWKDHNRRGKVCNRWSNGRGGQKHPETRQRPNYYSSDYGYRGVWQLGEYQAAGWTDGDRIEEQNYNNNYLADNHN